VKSKVGSGGRREDEGTTVCPLSLKNSKKTFLISVDFTGGNYKVDAQH
jgi:hypothetical protein